MTILFINKCKSADQTLGIIKWAVSLVILHMVTSIFLRGLCGYIWVNILTLSPQRGLMWRMVDCAVLMATNVDRGGVLRSAMTYCHGQKKVLPDASMAALMVRVPPEDLPCAPPDVPPDICNNIERDHSVLFCSNMFKSGRTFVWLSSIRHLL